MASVACTLVLSLLLGSALAGPADHGHRLPDGFLIGAGTSAYQTEGAWDEDGKGVSALDYIYHEVMPAVLGEWPAWRTGDVAADSYHRYKEDIDMAAYLGFNALRLSISWTRIFPSGRNDSVNARGVQHYHDVLDYMRARGIEPIVTLHHFDEPQALRAEFGGWEGDQMPELFAAYADFLFNEYGSKVKYWLTINEAFVYCSLLSGSLDMTIPSHGERNPRIMRCLHQTILGHALAYRLYDAKYRGKQHGLVGFGVGAAFFRGASDAREDLDAAEAANGAVGIGLSIDPLVFGDYPASAAIRPAFTDEQKRLLKGSIDFAGLNMYSGKTVNASSNATVIGFGGATRGPTGLQALRALREHGTYSTDSAWVLREMPKWFKQRYGALPIFITENGAKTGTAVDDWNTRAVYCSAFLREMVAGIHEDKTNVIGYTAWSLIDSFEFHGFEQGWGLVHVDYSGLGQAGGATLARSPKASAAFFRRMAQTRQVPLVLPGSRPFGDADGPATSSATASSAAALGLLLALASVATAASWLQHLAPQRG